MDEHEDQDIREFFQNYRQKRPPQAILRNFESDVIRKIKSADERPWLSLSAIISLSTVGIFVAVFIFFILPLGRRAPVAPEPALIALESVPVMQPPVEQAPVPPVVPAVPAEKLEPAVPAVVEPVPAEVPPAVAPAVPEPATEEELFNAMAGDLFILEMLGEDEGILDDASRVSGDLEFLSQVSPST